MPNDAQRKLDLKEALEKEREVSNSKYADKLTEILVYGMVGLILTAFIIGIIAKIWAAAPSL